ncbi:type II toxin-antitoxin system RelE family toxin [Acetanaerobacterium elongatum]|uniref:mRNA interferase RelE/StbE n=1 Tax=Acetanaerobacterium elongatum TaxID=258515 RepID=A0A1H0E9K5_9FIRM|nr:addiction module toxin RelE [Acetanaerobacterium elongatum]SDN79001.1 mRNA interferase RelE/StbE [Acetanaerobacterium elongatum]
MNWVIEYTKSAEEDLKALDRSQQLQVLKAIKKVSLNPLPNTEGGYGKPLGNHLSSKLTGYLKIKLLKLGLRVVCSLVREDGIMKIIVISVRDDETVYRMAQDRIK